MVDYFRAFNLEASIRPSARQRTERANSSNREAGALYNVARFRLDVVVGSVARLVW